MNGHFALLLFFFLPLRLLVLCDVLLWYVWEEKGGKGWIVYGCISYSAILPYHLFGGYIFFILRVLMPLSSRPFL
jgi:hypothetical protein